MVSEFASIWVASGGGEPCAMALSFEQSDILAKLVSLQGSLAVAPRCTVRAAQIAGTAGTQSHILYWRNRCSCAAARRLHRAVLRIHRHCSRAGGNVCVVCYLTLTNWACDTSMTS